MSTLDHRHVRPPPEAPEAPYLRLETRLPDWALVVARGKEARAFLHGQLTQDMLQLLPGEVRLAGYCSAKGRLLATLWVWVNAQDEVFLAGSADVMPALVKRLSMFVLRADCKLQLLDWPVVGECAVQESGAPDTLAGWAVKTSSDNAVTSIHLPQIHLPGIGHVARVLRSGTELGLSQVPVSPPALDLWRGLEVASGIARVVARTQDQFVPQMLNWELVGGVNFKKGCYPGQEVVARSQYRGTLKRRTFLVEVGSPVSPGDEIFSQDDPTQPAGMVVLCAPAVIAPSGIQNAHPNTQAHTYWALVEVKLSAIQAQSTLRGGTPDGPVMNLQALPYAVPSSEVDD